MPPWPPQAPDVHGAQTHVQANPHPHNRNKEIWIEKKNLKVLVKKQNRKPNTALTLVGIRGSLLLSQR